MKNFMVATTLFFCLSALAQDKIKFNFINEEIGKVLEAYAKISSQKMIVDSTVRGKITILNSTDVDANETFNQLSEALAVNGFGIIKNGDTMTVKNARSVQRDNIETSNTLPALKPQRMATWIVNLKNVSASDLIKDLRLFTSSYGEMAAVHRTNQLVITDWTSNLQRVSALVAEVDIKIDSKTEKIISEVEKRHKQNHKNKKEIKEEKEIKIKE